MKKLLFVCTGNTCRSSMAEAIAKSIIIEKGMDVSASSAGIYAAAGDRASYQAVEVMKGWGIDIKGHCARRLNSDMVKDSDIIITMTEEHKKLVLMSFAEAKDKVFTMKELAYGKPGNISDPYGCDVYVYSECANELKNAISIIMDRIQEIMQHK